MKKLVILLICLLLTAPAMANGNGKDNGKKHKHLPPGLAKKVERGGELPPGWQKKVAAGEVLDEDLYKRAKPLSDEERRRYPSTSKAGTKLLKIENKIIRVMDATRVILDVLDEVSK